MTTSNPTSVYVMRCKANPAVVTPLVFVPGRKSQTDFLIFRTCFKNCSVIMNVRNDQCVGLHVAYMRDNVSQFAEFHHCIRIHNLLQRDMWTCRCEMPCNSTSPIHWLQDSLRFSEERGFVENPHGFHITMTLLALRSIRQCIYKIITEVPSRNHCRRGEAVSIAYSESVSVTLVIQHALRMCIIILPSVACPALQQFPTLSHKRHEYREKKLQKTKRVFWFALQISHSSKKNSARYDHKYLFVFR